MIIGGNLFLNVSEIFDVDALKEALTVQNPEYLDQLKHGSSYTSVPKTVSFYRMHDDIMEVPRNIPTTYYRATEHNDLRMKGGKTKGDFSFVGSLRSYQAEYEKYLPDNDMVIQMPCGTGKTVLALYKISSIKLRTIVIVPTLYLANQWMERIHTFLPNVTAKIGKTKDDYLDADIYVLNIDRLKAKDYDAKFYAYWGILILDEGHRYGSPTYQPEIGLFPAHYRFALTATFRRSDGMCLILSYHFGKVWPMNSPFPCVKVLPLKTGIWVDPNDFVQRGKLSYSLLDNWISLNMKRNFLLLSVIEKCLKNGRTVLFLSKRREALEGMCESVKRRGYKCALIVGNLSEKKQTALLEYAQKEAQAIFGIAQLAKEGMDIDRLDTVIFHHPMKDIEQSIGRVRRFLEGKKEPLCIYPVDDIAPYYGMFKAAMKSAIDVKILGTTDYKTFLNG